MTEEDKDITPELDFIRTTFDWDSPQTPSIIANLNVSKISLDDLADILGITVDEVKHNIETRPLVKSAYASGPKFADAQIANRIYHQAVNGDRASQTLWVTKRLSNKTTKPEIVVHEDPMKMLEANVPSLIQRGLELAYDTDDLSKYNSYLNIVLDRVYGKSTEKVETEITHKYVIMGVAESIDADSWRQEVIEHAG